MKYLLINQRTGEETLCEKVSIDEFDYYVCNAVPYPNDAVRSSITNTIVRFTDPRYFSEGTYKKVIATNNPNVNIPKVVDEVEIFSKNLDKSKCRNFRREHTLKEVYEGIEDGFIIGYNKSQETHPFSEGDMIEFNKWICDSGYMWNWRYEAYTLTMIPSEREVKICGKSAKELLQLWKSQQPKKVYYNLLFNTK